ncbi:CTD small phosphatase-like protein [Trichinella pseudospiralis]
MVSTSQGAYQTNPSENKKALSSLLSSVDLPKLTVVFDLDWTLIYASKQKLFPAQQRLASGKCFVAIRPHCITLLKIIRPLCNIMMFSAGTESYVKDVLTLIDPNGEYFDKILSRNSCTNVHGMWAKDLAKTGADLKRTVLIDDRRQSFLLQPNNGIPIRPWTGQEDDTELVKMEKLIMELIDEKNVCEILKLKYNMERIESLSRCGGLRSHVDDRRCPTLVVSADYDAALLSSQGAATTAAFSSNVDSGLSNSKRLLFSKGSLNNNSYRIPTISFEYGSAQNSSEC